MDYGSSHPTVASKEKLIAFSDSSTHLFQIDVKNIYYIYHYKVISSAKLSLVTLSKDVVFMVFCPVQLSR